MMLSVDIQLIVDQLEGDILAGNIRSLVICGIRCYITCSEKMFHCHPFVPPTEIIITSGGENMAPVPIEDAIKEEVPFLSNVMIIGDKKKYVTCLVTLKVCHMMSHDWLHACLVNL